MIRPARRPVPHVTPFPASPSGWPPGYHQQEAPGLSFETGAFGRMLGVRISLYFPNNGDKLLPNHLKLLEGVRHLLVAPSAYYELYALTDRRGDAGYNMNLSARRLAVARSELLRLGVGADKLTSRGKYFGEEFAEVRGAPDGASTDVLRAAAIYLWDGVAASRFVFADRPFLVYARAHGTPA